MGLTKIPDGRLRMLPLPQKEFYGYRQHYKSNPLQECNLPNKVYKHYISVWNEDKKEWQTLECGEKLYKALQDAREELKRKFNTFQEPIVTIKDGNVGVRPPSSVLG